MTISLSENALLRFPDTDAKKIELTIGNWFRGAEDRVSGRRKRTRNDEEGTRNKRDEQMDKISSDQEESE